MSEKIIRMDKLVKIFADTQDFITNDGVLKEAVKFSLEHTKLYNPEDYPELPNIPKKLGSTLTLNFKSFQAAMNFHKNMPDKKIAVLNFASATRPGGGVTSGSMAQEESLCRCSTLYPLINQQWLIDRFYMPNREANDPRYNDACIYSQDVVICKTDTDFPERLNHEDFFIVDIITCAAPNLKGMIMRQKNYNNINELFNIHLNRAKHILHISALNNVDILVTGAFGCGAFKNNPEIVAEAWKEALKNYRQKFDYVIFAIYFREHEINNFKAFNDKFNDN